MIKAQNGLATLDTLIDESSPRYEYGYGSGYINGLLSYEKLCFSQDNMAPCIEQVQVLEADQATGVQKDRFAGIIGLAPKSSDNNLAAFLG